MIFAALLAACVTGESIGRHCKAAVGIKRRIRLTRAGEDFQFHTRKFRASQFQHTVGKTDGFRARRIRPVQRRRQRARRAQRVADRRRIHTHVADDRRLQAGHILARLAARILNTLPRTDTDRVLHPVRVRGIRKIIAAIKRPRVAALGTSDRARHSPRSIASSVWINDWRGRNTEAETDELLRVPLRNRHLRLAAIVRENVVRRRDASIVSTVARKALEHGLWICGVKDTGIAVDAGNRAAVHARRAHRRSRRAHDVWPEVQPDERRCGSRANRPVAHRDNRRPFHRLRHKSACRIHGAVFRIRDLRPRWDVESEIAASACQRTRTRRGLEHDTHGVAGL